MKKRFAAVLITLTATAAIAATVSFNGNGQFSYYNNVGYGACGTQINAATELLAAVPAHYWTAANSNKDPLCKMVVKASYQGKTIKVPVKDKCPGCSPDKIELSQPAFARFGSLDLGIIKGASWSIEPP